MTKFYFIYLNMDIVVKTINPIICWWIYQYTYSIIANTIFAFKLTFDTLRQRQFNNNLYSSLTSEIHIFLSCVNNNNFSSINLDEIITKYQLINFSFFFLFELYQFLFTFNDVTAWSSIEDEKFSSLHTSVCNRKSYGRNYEILKGNNLRENKHG